MNKLILKGLIALSIVSYVSYMLLTTDDTLDTIKTKSIEKITLSITNDLERAMPLINQAGYKIFSIQAQLNIPPKVNAVFELEKIVDSKKQEVILQALDDNTIGKLVLTSLMNAFSIDKAISIKNMELKKINIGISLPPSVTVEYK